MSALAELQVGKARPGEASRLSRALSSALFHDPMMRWALPDDARRRRILPGAFELFATAILPYGEGRTTGGGGP